MSDSYGAIGFPVATSSPAGDQALQKIGSFLQAAINAYAGAAWSAARPRPADALAIKSVFTYAPELQSSSFSDQKLPALFVSRVSGETSDYNGDWRVDDSMIRALWVMPSSTRSKDSRLMSFVNAVAKSADYALKLGSHPSWQDAGDTDTLATTLAADTDAIKLSIASPTVLATYSGAGLSGAIGAGTIAPRRAITVTTSAQAGGYSTASPILVTGEDFRGTTQTVSIALTQVNGGETVTAPYEFRKVTQVVVPAQPSALGSIQIGLGGFTGRGSVLTQRAGLMCVAMKSWKPTTLKIDIRDGEDRIQETEIYDALEMLLRVEEKTEEDPANTLRGFFPSDVSGGGLDLAIDDTEGFIPSTASLPDDGIYEE